MTDSIFSLFLHEDRMKDIYFDRERLSQGRYDSNDGLCVAKAQCTVKDFRTLVRKGGLDDVREKILLVSFYQLVDNDNVWHLGETVGPEFRLPPCEQCILSLRV